MSDAFVFGKLPAHGDFVARGLGVAARAAWDDFLSASLADARNHFGPDFDARYDAAPAWRFAIDDAGVRRTGAIAPSVDSAGRRFPLVLGRAGPAGGAAACEDLLYIALGDGLTADQCHARLEALDDSADDDAAEGWWIDGGGDAGIAPLGGRHPQTLLRAMLAVTEVAQ